MCEGFIRLKSGLGSSESGREPTVCPCDVDCEVLDSTNCGKIN